MRIVYKSLPEALECLCMAEKTTPGEFNPADKLILDFWEEQAYSIELDYTDAEHRIIRVINWLNGKDAPAREWRDNDINFDQIASYMFNEFYSDVESIFKFIASQYFVRKFQIYLKSADNYSVSIDTSMWFVEDNMDPLVDKLHIAKVYFSYSDDERRERLIEGIQSWMKEHNRSYSITEEK